jgi:adenylate cyclase
MKLGRRTRHALTAAASAAAVTGTLVLSAGGGPLFNADMTVSDMLYQRPAAISGEVVVIGIDEQSLNDFGPFPWPRDILAMVTEELNRDADNRPAVIGLDILFTGGSVPEADAYLAEAAGEYGNVVVAMAAMYGSSVEVTPNDKFFIKRNVVTAFDEPFTQMKKAAEQGHINALLDVDGILRHGLFFVENTGGEHRISFAATIFNKYAAARGLGKTAAPIIDKNGFFYIPYSALPGAYYLASVSDVAAGVSLDLAGKIVLVGPYASGMRDMVRASVARTMEMYGVEVHANIIESFLRESYKREAPIIPQALIMLIITFLSALWFWDRRILPATAAWLLVTAGGLAAAAGLYAAGVVIHAFWLPLAETALYIFSVALNYTRAALETRRVTNMFKRYTAPEIVNEILKEGTDSLGLSGRLRDIAVLFVDIRGFTSLSELLMPEEVVEILNSYLELTSTCIINNNGTLDKFIGDAVMAFWGAPLPQEDCIYKAVSAAMEMVEKSHVFSRNLLVRSGRSVSFGVGVHYGPAVIGSIGTSLRMDYTAIGGTVSTAARLESNAPPGEILVSRAVADALKGRVAFESLGFDIKLKGKAGDFEVLRVIGRNTDELKKGQKIKTLGL